MLEKLQIDEAKTKYRKRKQSSFNEFCKFTCRARIDPVFGIRKSVLGFTRFHLRGIDKVKTEWMLITLAHNYKQLTKLAA